MTADDRLHIVEPADSADVALPMEVRWTAAADTTGKFAVFFDRAPMRPGASLRSLVPSTDPCRTEPGCPNSAWLADRHIFITTETRISVNVLAEKRRNNHTRDHHRVTVIMLDNTGHRVGESAFTREFTVKRKD